MTDKTGGPDYRNVSTEKETERLRDEFAMAALPFLGADYMRPAGIKFAAQIAYAFADAMIAAREAK